MSKRKSIIEKALDVPNNKTTQDTSQAEAHRLITFLRDSRDGEHHPRKRLKHSARSQPEDCTAIILHEETITLGFQNQPDPLEPISYSNIDEFVYVDVSEVRGEQLVHLAIHQKERGKSVKQGSLLFGQNMVCVHGSVTKDLSIALRVASDASSLLNPRDYGRLWTQQDIEIGSAHPTFPGGHYIQLKVTIKWNTTRSLLFVPVKPVYRSNLDLVLGRYLGNECKITTKQEFKPSQFYAAVHVPERGVDNTDSLDLPSLQTRLYPFQKRAVDWLLKREGVEQANDNAIRKVAGIGGDSLPYSFSKHIDRTGRVFYFSKLYRLVTTDLAPFYHAENLRGGILAEEMGLGKTLEMIALISLHRRNMEEAESQNWTDVYGSANITPTRATLIVTPTPIVQQWMEELQRHAPELKVMHYCGARQHMIEDIMACDVVLATYTDLSKEIWYTLPVPDRSLRRSEQRPPRKISPLTALSWWRVCLDEAQMVESGVSSAAKVVKLIPRMNAWAVTGTPIKKDVADLFGLLNFLRLEPYATLKYFWTTLIEQHPTEFKQLFSQLALRHTKHTVRDELEFKGQQRYVITIPFTATEEQLYKNAFQEMCAEAKLDRDGGPIVGDWTLETYGPKMSQWLERLRQLCLHPEVGGVNRLRLGTRQRPLRTLSEVLAVLTDQTNTSLRSMRRELLLKQLKRGQFYENSPRVNEALQIWTEVRSAAETMVEVERKELAEAVANANRDGDSGFAAGASSESEDVDDDERGSEQNKRLSKLRNRLRNALEVLHVAVFFQSNAYFQLMEKEEQDSEEYKRLEKLQVEGYDQAKTVRQEALTEIFNKADNMMQKLSTKAKSQDFVQLPEFRDIKLIGGIETRGILTKVNTLAEALDAQANQLDDWREETIEVLLRPLVDKDNDVDITGEEYEDSTKIQDELIVRIQALRTVMEDRSDALTGQHNLLISNEATAALKMAADGEGHDPKRLIELLKIREEIKPSTQLGSFRGVLADLRTLVATLSHESGQGRPRAQVELGITEQLQKEVQKMFNEQIKAVEGLRQEVRQFATLMNTRLEYYRQFQELSDMVAALEDPNDWTLHDNILAEEIKLKARIDIQASTARYLMNIKEGAECSICGDQIQAGILTTCGHQFCKDCLMVWFKQRRNCPMCKQNLSKSDLTDIIDKRQTVIVAKELVSPNHSVEEDNTIGNQHAIYSKINNDTLGRIKDVYLRGSSYSSKIDAIARHLMYLRSSDPGSKSVIFSQFRDFLDVLATAFTQYGVSFRSFDHGGIESFKLDPSVECFLLHGKAQSSGLNLVCASHVFLCEPLINTAIELQAIARVDRIGQLQKTHVYLYLIEDTVEERIYDISVKRRLEHISAHGKGKRAAVKEEPLEEGRIEEANNAVFETGAASLALLAKGKTGGENVDKNDLWACLFGSGAGKRTGGDGKTYIGVEVDPLLRRELAAMAAEERMQIHESTSGVAATVNGSI